MSLNEKIAKAKTSNWLQEGLKDDEVKSIKELAIISANIERKRVELGMNQKQFAEYMGVSQGMVSKWESGEYNFTISTLNEICGKLNIKFIPYMKSNLASQFRLIPMPSKKNRLRNEKLLNASKMEEIA